MAIKGISLHRAETKIRKVISYFETQEGEVTRALNKTAKIRNLEKSCKIKIAYPKASKVDLIALVSPSRSNAANRFVYISPKTLKEYNVIIKSRNPNGTIRIRILDDEGAFVRQAVVKQPKVIVLDSFSVAQSPLTKGEPTVVPHGDIVKSLIERNNPMNDYEFIDIAKEGFNVEPQAVLKQLVERVNNGEKIDAISCSFGMENSLDALEEFFRTKIKGLPQEEQKSRLKRGIQRLLSTPDEKLSDNPLAKKFKENIINFKLFEQLKQKGVKVFIGAGNDTQKIDGKLKETLNLSLLIDGTEGVGALNEAGKIAEYSSSRKAVFTPHYECGDIRITHLKNGFNVSGGRGVDIPYTKTAQSQYNAIKNLSPYSRELQVTDGQYFYRDIPVDCNFEQFTVSPSVLISHGTSWAAPRRTAEYTKYQTLKNLI